MNTPGDHVLQTVINDFHKYKALAERAFVQLPDADFHWQSGDEQNSIAVIMQHLASNMRPRWTDFLTSDGEKPDRNRDCEFVDPAVSRETLMKCWEEGWECLFSALTPLTDADLERRVTIRGEPHSVMQAINRQVAHYSYHVGQIVFLAKQLKSSGWNSLSVPRNKSAEFNRKVAAGEASQR